MEVLATANGPIELNLSLPFCCNFGPQFEMTLYLLARSSPDPGAGKGLALPVQLSLLDLARLA